MKIILNKTRSSRERYLLISEAFGSYGEPVGHANRFFSVVSGVDRGGGYQMYMSVSYALAKESCLPCPVRAKLRAELTRLGFTGCLIQQAICPDYQPK